MRIAHVGKNRSLALLIVGAVTVSALLVLAASGRLWLPMQLQTVSSESLHELGISLFQSGATDGQLRVSAAFARGIVQRSYSGMGPVKEEVLARVHFRNNAPLNDQICWVLVQPTGPTDSAGHSKVFGLEVIDAHNGTVLWAGGQMAVGGGP
jgi:hypothetical protein